MCALTLAVAIVNLAQREPTSSRLLLALFSGAAIGILGGLIGLGGAEFRLPLLLTVFGFVALEAVILNKTISLVVVLSAIASRSTVVPTVDVIAQWPILLNLLAGSLGGAWLGAGLTTRLPPIVLRRAIALLLGIVSLVLAFGHDSTVTPAPLFEGPVQFAIGIVAGLGIGVIASLLGVAGGEFLIPTLVLLFGVEIRLAGSLSLAISLPTMLVGLARYSREQSFRVVHSHAAFGISMAAGSVAGVYLGARLLAIVPSDVIAPLLAALLALSAIKIWSHR